VGQAVDRNRRRRLGEVLVGQGVLTEEQVSAALQSQQDVPEGRPRRRLGQVIIECGFATERQIAEALAEALGLPLVDLGRTLVVPEAVRLLPRAVAERSGVLVIAKDGGRLTVATADPTNVLALDDVKLYTGALELHVVVAVDSQVRDHLARSWSLSEDSSGMSTLVQDIGSNEEENDSASAQAVEAAPIVRLVDVVLADAVRARASDVHVEPQAGDLRIRYRVDGLLRDVMTVPRGATAAAVSRIKILSGLDIAERRKPQDGRAKLSVDGYTVEARISTLPTLHGEKVVIRILPRADNVPLLSATGLTPAQQNVLAGALQQAQGLVLITGPTGSGKTNTLYASIQQVSTPDRNIVTLEDPVEVQVAGITQVQVHERSGLTFARGLRSILRQDPDIVLVGEVRDQETAELALQASLTGHLVLTTLHTNDAVSAITRLVDMGVEPFLVASSLTLVVAQRLVRTPCEACAAPYAPAPRVLEMLGLHEADLAGATPRMGRGCADCGGTGYRGRTGIYEVLPISATLRKVLLATPTEAAIGAAARDQGMTTLRASALAAAHRGATSYEEVLRVTQVDAVAGPRCPSCARSLADDMVVCPWDGTPVRRDLCLGCERPLLDEWSTCPWCKTAVTRTELPIPRRREP
jgi:type IV pilus assembly protein PilB